MTKSTVPVGTGREVARIIRKTRPDAEFDVASNPEFLREGSAIERFPAPGPGGHRHRQRARPRESCAQLYRPLYLIETPIVYAPASKPPN